MNIKGDEKTMIIDVEISGSPRSYFFDQYQGANANMINNKATELMEAVISGNGQVDTVYNLILDKESNNAKISVGISLKEKVAKIGSYKILELPTVFHAYNDEIIEKDKRSYPINYLEYESSDKYYTEYNITLEDGEFVEIPENTMLSFKGHTYSKTYEKTSTGLKVIVEARPSSDRIDVEDYLALREYITKVLDAKEEFIGYK